MLTHVNKYHGELSICEQSLQEYLRYQHEVLLDVTDKLLDSDNKVVEEYLLQHGKADMHYSLEYHQKIMMNFFYFKDINILNNYLVWLYRVSYSRDIDLNFFQIQFGLWKSICTKYLSHFCAKEINGVYDFLINNHEHILKEALNYPKETDEQIIQQLYEAIIQADVPRAIQLCEPYCKNLEDFYHFVSDIMARVMEKIGFEWEVNHISVAKEHIGTSTMESVLEHFFQKLSAKQSNHKTILLANGPHEQHTLMLRVLNQILSKLGYKVINIGADSPAGDILKTIEEFKPDFITFSITLCINLYEIFNLINAIRERETEYTNNIIIAGRAFINIQNPCSIMDANKYSDNLVDYIQYLEENSSLL
jgi:methanogenic corrinoid protein MtbC1